MKRSRALRIVCRRFDPRSPEDAAALKELQELEAELEESEEDEEEYLGEEKSEPEPKPRPTVDSMMEAINKLPPADKAEVLAELRRLCAKR